MKKTIIFLYMFFVVGAFVFGGSQNYEKVFRTQNSQGEFTLLSYHTYVTKDGKRGIELRLEAKNTLARDKNLAQDAQSTLEIGAKKEHYFELRYDKRIYQANTEGTIQHRFLAPQENFSFNLSFLVDAADPLEDFQIRFASPTTTSPWFALASFIKNGPQDGCSITKTGYFSLQGYYLSEQPNKKNKKQLYLTLKVGNDQGYSHYVTAGFLPKSALVYANQGYYFELTDGANTFKPSNIVSPVKRRNTGRDTAPTSTEHKLLPGEYCQVSLTFALPAQVDVTQLKVRYRDPANYVTPSDWLPLAPYMQNIPPYKTSLKKTSSKTAKQTELEK